MAHKELQDEPRQQCREEGEDHKGDEKSIDIEREAAENQGCQDQRNGVRTQTKNPGQEKTRHGCERSDITPLTASP